MIGTITKSGMRLFALMVALAATITLMIAPDLNLVPARYAEGDIIPENIVIGDNVALVDERSSTLRLSEALEEAPPIYDFDQRLRARTVEMVKQGFASMREKRAELRGTLTDSEARLRRNSLIQIDIRALVMESRARSRVIERTRRWLIGEIGLLTDLEKRDARQEATLEKRRFDLLAVTAQQQNAKNEIDQLIAKFDQAKLEQAKLRDELAQARQNEEQSAITLKADFEKALGLPLDDNIFQILNQAQFNADLEKKVLSLILDITDEKVVAAREGLPTAKGAIQIQALEGEKLERFENLDSIVDVNMVRERINQIGQQLSLPGEAAAYREGIIALAQRLVRPNLTENKGATERFKQDLAENLSPVYINLKKGDVVARAGDTATAQQVEIIRALNNYNLANPKYPQIIGTFLIVLIALALSYRLIQQRTRLEHTNLSRLLLMSLLLLIPLLFAQVILAVVPALTTVYDFVPSGTYNLLIPVALTSMLAGILMSFEVAVFLGVVGSLSMAIMLGNSLPVFLFGLMGSFVASVPVQHYENRITLWLQGLRISAMNVLVLGVMMLLESRPFPGWAFIMDVAAAAANGMGVALLTATMLPIFEKLFDITTNLRLLELANMNHPALRELSVRAPGTYHHSIVVGNLSESAAEGITANQLLVRVSSYYHDLGKMLCPLYFVENQGKKNYHDDLPAHTSARIIINHVKDGLEIARRYKLGSAIMGIIGQHHGNSLVRFFYHKAIEEAEETGKAVEESDFRYPGPNPQTKEAGLVMVADVTEAATRSLHEPSPESIREMVQKLTTRVYMEGLLDQSGMTFNDLSFIEKTFTRMLVSIHHHRIAYPDLPPPLEMREQEAPGETPTDEDQLAARRASS